MGDTVLRDTPSNRSPRSEDRTQATGYPGLMMSPHIYQYHFPQHHTSGSARAPVLFVLVVLVVDDLGNADAVLQTHVADAVVQAHVSLLCDFQNPKMTGYTTPPCPRVLPVVVVRGEPDSWSRRDH